MAIKYKQIFQINFDISSLNLFGLCYNNKWLSTSLWIVSQLSDG